MENYNEYNAANVLENINKCIDELEIATSSADYDPNRICRVGWSGRKSFYISAVCIELSIFDWWNETLSLSQLKTMRSFVKTAIKLGFTGYVCFKVGAAGCANGMWAETAESTDGYSPKESNTLYHSFVAGDNYYDCKINDKWLSAEDIDKSFNEHTLADVKAFMASYI